MKLASFAPLLCTALLFPSSAPAQTRNTLQHWVGSWAASQQVPEPNNVAPSGSLDHGILREVVHLSLGGSSFRLHLSNAFGTRPLHLAAVHVARPVSPAGAAIQPGTDRPVLFDSAPDVIIPAGAEYLSDPIAMPVAPLSDLAVTIQTLDPPDVQTGHPGSRATTWFSKSAAPGEIDLPGAQAVDHWYLLSGVDVSAPTQAASIVALGDSITDGHGATNNGNDRWTDVLARRLQNAPTTRSLAVLNQGIGGNHLLTDGLGPNALARFDRDVLAQTGVRYVVVLEGVNDLGGSTINGDISPQAHAALVARLLGSYEQIIERAHSHGLLVYGATITPYTGSGYYHPGSASEADRVALNQWIRQPGHFDGLIDFDLAIRDPEHPEKLLPRFDSGDHLHPSVAGYRAMADAIPLRLLFTKAR